MNISKEINYKFLLENDNNPIIIFDYNGKILFINDNGEILISYVSKKEIFELALNNAPHSYGSKITQIDLTYDRLCFYAINVSYNSDEWIAIRLYYKPKNKTISNNKNKVLTNINSLLDIAITQFKINYNTNVKLFIDIDIPEILLNQNDFSKLLRKTFLKFKDADEVNIELKFAIGEHIIINDKKYSLIYLTFSSNISLLAKMDDIKELSSQLDIVCSFYEYKINFEIPLIAKN